MTMAVAAPGVIVTSAAIGMKAQSMFAIIGGSTRSGSSFA